MNRDKMTYINLAKSQEQDMYHKQKASPGILGWIHSLWGRITITKDQVEKEYLPGEKIE